jgi:hypothetical protein
MSKAVIYHIEDYALGFSRESIRRNYRKKENFFRDIADANKGIDRKELEKVLEIVWSDAFPPEEKETNKKGAE